MSINNLIGGDCGSNNSLIQLSNIISRDAVTNRPLSEEEILVNEFMTHNTPQTFNMTALINNVPQIENVGIQNMTRPAPNYFLNSPVMSPWLAGPSTSYMPPQPFMHPYYTMPQQPVMDTIVTNLQVEFVDKNEAIHMTNNNIEDLSHKYVDTFKEDDELAYNQFMSFMKNISAGGLNLAEPDKADQRNLSKDEVLGEIEKKYKEEWEKLSDVTDYWDTEAANGITKEYNFTQGNIMLENKSALEIGKEKLKMGDIPGAVLCFEAAAQQQPGSAEAWFYLGTTQSENEQDPLAITALKNSLDIDPRQLEAYITLAAAYTNENMPKYAFKTLLGWLKASPKYSDLFPHDVDTQKMDVKSLETHVKNLYLKAAQLHPTQVDPDVQNALGVVFNISQEYEKAVDCFKTALLVADDNAKLWNRLGATLANSERSEEAVDAYCKALDLEPGFIRARYNVGITCMNLGAHRQAAEHFLVSLNLQNKAKSMYPDTLVHDTSSSTIWTTLRMVCSFMGEHHVSKLVDEKNLVELNKFFDMQ